MIGLNAYADLTTFKSKGFANVTGTTDDTRLRGLLEQASRVIDRLCERFFYCWNGTRYYDGAYDHIYLDDILSVTTFKLDEDGDGTYEVTMAATDYRLYELNEYPKTWAKINPQGNYGGFAGGIQKGVEIAGVFGYGDGVSATPYETSGITCTVADGTTTTVTVSAEDTIAPGHTILVESEQMYVLTATTDGSKTITVRRGMNGTTGAAHSAKTAYIYTYPMEIWQSALIEATRIWKRKDTGFVTAMVGSPEVGTLNVYKELDPYTREAIKKFHKYVHPQEI